MYFIGFISFTFSMNVWSYCKSGVTDWLYSTLHNSCLLTLVPPAQSIRERRLNNSHVSHIIIRWWRKRLFANCQINNKQEERNLRSEEGWRFSWTPLDTTAEPAQHKTGWKSCFCCSSSVTSHLQGRSHVRLMLSTQHSLADTVRIRPDFRSHSFAPDWI